MGNILAKKNGLKREERPCEHVTAIGQEKIDDDPESHIVRELVERYLKDEHLNSKYIPDFIEKKMYSNMLRVSVGLLRDTLEHTKLEVLGHRITINMVPIEDDTEASHDIVNKTNIMTM